MLEASELWINDTPTHLREWGTTRTHSLKTLASGGHLYRRKGSWTLETDFPVQADGIPSRVCTLTPGMELVIGRTRFVIESERWRALHRVMSRLLGWGAGARKNIDHALRSVRMAAHGRQALVICGEGNIAAIAKCLHSHTLGLDHPFVVCGARHTVRDLKDTISEALGGTLCVWQSQKLTGLSHALAALQDHRRQLQVVVCTNSLLRREALICSPVVIPPLHRRRHELRRIVDGYASDAMQKLGTAFKTADRDWIRDWICKHEARTLPQIELAASRLAALRHHQGSVKRVADQLGMSQSALREWLLRRKLGRTSRSG